MPEGQKHPPQLTPTAGRLELAKLRPSVSEAIDLARARGKMASGGNVPSRMPGEPPIYVGSGGHAADLKTLTKLDIKAVCNCAPSVCKDPVDAYKSQGIGYLQLDAQDDRSFPLLEKCLQPVSDFVGSMQSEGKAVLIHCMAGVNRSATLAVAYLLLRSKRNLFDLFSECVAARPSILQNPSFQLQLCTLAHRHGLLTMPPPSPMAATAAAATATRRVGPLLDGAQQAPNGERPPAAADPMAAPLKAHALTGNCEMAEDLERVACRICGRSFAPSVHVRHVPICEARAAKEKAKAERMEASAKEGNARATEI